MDPVYGIHLGLVVSSGPDPENRNRIQVWVPYLSNTLYGSLNQKLKDVKFKGPEDLNNIDKDILTTLQTTLPWAEYGAPLFGGSSGAFNSATGKTAVNSGSTIQANNNGDSGLPTTSANQKTNGTKPTQVNTLIQGSVNTLTTTRYSFGKDRNGPDKNQDTNTNNGVGAIGGQTQSNGILGPGAAASNSYPIGTILLNRDTGEKVMIVDRPRENIVGTVDIWRDPSLYNSAPTGDQQYQVLGEVSTKGLITNTDLQNVLSDSKYAGKIPEGKSASEWLAAGSDAIAAASNNGTMIAGASDSGPNLRTYADRAAAVGCEPSNVGTTGSPVGTFSTPNGGTKVWVFFMGGDIQRPVYFAQSPNPGDINALRG
jgi:hypothetical protein